MIGKTYISAGNEEHVSRKQKIVSRYVCSLSIEAETGSNLLLTGPPAILVRIFCGSWQRTGRKPYIVC
ncbi:MAG: hypothetical protein ACLRMZ_21870 [Blautia marasmi]